MESFLRLIFMKVLKYINYLYFLVHIITIITSLIFSGNYNSNNDSNSQVSIHLELMRGRRDEGREAGGILFFGLLFFEEKMEGKEGRLVKEGER